MVSEYESELSKKLMGQAKEEERSFGYWTPSVRIFYLVIGSGSTPPHRGHVKTDADCERCDVYVAAGTQVDLSIRLKLIAELWRSGISADLQYDDERTLEDVTKECEDQSTP
jgi:translation initiation factor 2-alpha kinase 4